MPVFIVEIDGKQYDIEGDRAPNESEARQAVGAYTSAPRTHDGRPLPAGPGPNELRETTPAPQDGAMSRLMQPIGRAAMALASIPGQVLGGARNTVTGENGGYGGSVDRAGHGMVDPQVEQARKALSVQTTSEAIGHGAAAVLPFFGPQAAGIGEAVGDENYAGALGQTAVMAASVMDAPAYASKAAQLLKQRAAARILGVMRPDIGKIKTAAEIAPEVVQGVAGRETRGGIGVGTRKTLAERASRWAKSDGAEIEAYQALDTPADPRPMSDRLRVEAAKRETVPPDRLETTMHSTGELDEFGNDIVELQDNMVPGTPQTKNPALVNALRDHADEIDGLASQYPDEQVPVGELFKQRAVVGERIGGKAYEKMPGATKTPHEGADVAFRSHASDFLHDTVPASQISDNAYHVTRNLTINLQKSRLRDMMGRDGKQIVNLLAGRLAGAALGGATGMASGFGPMAGAGGAVVGVVLGESAFWGSLRATTYNEMANLLRAGDIDGAAQIAHKAALVYAAEKSRKDRDRNAKAHAALKSQAEGVVAP